MFEVITAASNYAIKTHVYKREIERLGLWDMTKKFKE